MPERTRIACKDCCHPVFFTSATRELEIARNLSAPERCPECRQKNRDEINQVGQSYWIPKIETDDRKRCWGKFGLGRLKRDRREPVSENYKGIPVDLPLRAAKNPADPAIPDEWRELAEKFARIAPIAQELVDKLTAPRSPRVFVLVGPTGTGKSTWVPYRLLRSPVGEQGRILVTQPRTITLRSDKGTAIGPAGVPGYIASELMGLKGHWTGAGQEIGIQYKDVYDQRDTYTRLLFVTDGTLINMIRSGDVGNYRLVMIDEAHEQSRNMELIFALLKQRMPLYPQLKLLIASATIDVDKFANFFGAANPENVCVVSADQRMAISAGTLKSIHDRFIAGSVDHNGRPAPSLDFGALAPKAQKISGEPENRLALIPAAVAEVVSNICRDHGKKFTKLGLPKGDILVFVPRIKDVENTQQAIQALGLELGVFPCHAQLKRFSDYDQSDKAAKKAMDRGEPSNPQRVIIATNYAETSVTMSNLRYVIDTGLILQAAWDPVTCSTGYKPVWHSQAGCKQRKGRVGRLQEGECFRLYTKTEHDAMPKDTPPEVSRIPLDTFFLEAKASGIEDLATFDWLGKNSDAKAEIERASQVLTRRGVLDPDGDITDRGVEFSGFQVNSVDLALCMSESDAFACTLEMGTFLAFLQGRSKPFLSGDVGGLGYMQWRCGCHDDLDLYLRLFHHWSSHPDRKKPERRKSWFEERGVNTQFLEEVEMARKNLARTISRRTHDSVTWRALDLKRLHRARLIIARCLPEWIYIKDPSTGMFRPNSPDKCPCPDAIRVDGYSACLSYDDLQAFVCIGRTRTKNGSVYAQHVVSIDPSWIPRLKDSPVGLAVLLRESIHTEPLIADNSSKIVTITPSRPSLFKCAKNQRIQLNVVRRLKHVANEHDRTNKNDDRLVAAYLCEDANGVPVIAEIDGVFHPNDRFQAVASKVGTGFRLPFTQRPIIEELTRGRVPLQVVVLNSDSDKDDSKKIFALFVRVPLLGVAGRLHRKDMGFEERDFLLTKQPGTLIQAVPWASELNKLGSVRIRFVTPAMAQALQTVLRVGDKRTSIVVKKLYYKSGKRGGPAERPEGRDTPRS